MNVQMAAATIPIGLTVVIGLVVVFGVLIFLTLLFYLFGMVMSKAEKTEKPKKPIAPPSIKVLPRVKTTAPVPVVQASISEEVIAVIAAAVAAMSADDGKQYTVRQVSRARTQRPVWAAAGLAESTRPF